MTLICLGNLQRYPLNFGERTGEYRENRGRIKPKAHDIRVNIVVGVTTLTFSDPGFKKQGFFQPRKFGNP